MPKKSSQKTSRRPSRAAQRGKKNAVPPFGRARSTKNTSRHLLGRLVLHPLAVFGMLLGGVLLAGFTLQAFADSLQVTARIEASPLASAATIDSPSSGQTLASKPITVSGTCPDESYLKLYRNGMFSGAAICEAGSYSIETDLFEGLNTLKVQAYNRTDLPGPETPAIEVTYAAPAKPGTNPTTPVQPYVPPAKPSAGMPNIQQPTSPPLIWTDYRFSVITTSSKFSWKLRYQSGTPPYKTAILWGDTTRSDIVVPHTNEFEISHTYEHPGYYPISIVGTDGKGVTNSLQLFALVKLPGTPGTISNILRDTTQAIGSAQDQGSPSRWLWFAWPTYGVLLLMVMSFWLGERREYLELMKHGRRLGHIHR